MKISEKVQHNSLKITDWIINTKIKKNQDSSKN